MTKEFFNKLAKHRILETRKYRYYYIEAAYTCIIVKVSLGDDGFVEIKQYAKDLYAIGD